MIMRRITVLTLGFLTMVSQAEEPDEAYLAFLQSRGEESWINANAEHPLANSANRPIPALETFAANPDKQALGFQLFHETRLSRNGTVSCSSCHTGMMGGADGQKLSRGVDGLFGVRNSPTVINSAFNFRQFWDGRSFDLDSQSLQPISNPLEMGHDLDAAIQKLAAIPSYVEQFNALYPDGLTAANLGNAIAQHSRDMTRSDSRFNQQLSTGVATLTEQEQRGWQRFNDVGCASCHNGINLGGNSYQKSVNVTPLSKTTMQATLDEGLFSRTGREQDYQVFKVPTLNNVALTAPYFHDGSVNTLDEAVRQMGQSHAGRNLSDSDVDDIVSFLGSLSSEFFGGMASHMGNMGMMNGMRGGMHQRMQQEMQNMHRQQQGHHMNHAQQHGADTDQARPMGRH
ncbi:MAG: hypothetical protein DHS20C12_03160 [Pseudohongiella sp.]|nr:MAG: hypothetical protein DHS20C12_03160 [Pseudohongiella sp.]